MHASTKMNLKTTRMSDRNQTKKDTHWIISYCKILENANYLLWQKAGKQVHEDDSNEEITKRCEQTFGVMDMVVTLVTVLVSWVYT